MSHFYQSLSLKIRRNFYEGKKQQFYPFPTVSAKNLKEKFAKLFLTEIQKNPSPRFYSSILPALKKKEKWRRLYKEFHFLAKNEQLTQNFYNKHHTDLKEAQKSIDLFSPTTRSFILALSWYLKKENQLCLIENYQYLNWFFKKKNFSVAAMSPLLKIKQVKKHKVYFFHHGLGSLDPIFFQKIIFFCLEGKKIFSLLLSEKKFIQFCRYTDNYTPREAEGFFFNLKVPLQKIYTKYFSHQSLPPAISLDKDFFDPRPLLD